MRFLRELWSIFRASKLPPQFSDLRKWVLLITVLGDFVQGGLIFGWNALAIMLTQLGNYSEDCTELSTTGAGGCKSQESHLAVLWTIGIFAYNFGPVLVGPVLDYFGPRVTSLLSILLNVVGLVFLATSYSSEFNGFYAGVIVLGLGGITYHLGQFHISNLFPGLRGFISALYVAGFTSGGIIFYILSEIFNSLHGTRWAYRGVMLGYAVVCCLWIPLYVFILPKDGFVIGQVFVYDKDERKVKTVQRKEMDRLLFRNRSEGKSFSRSMTPVDSSADFKTPQRNGAAAGGMVEKLDDEHDHVAIGFLDPGNMSSDNPCWQEVELAEVPSTPEQPAVPNGDVAPESSDDGKRLASADSDEAATPADTKQELEASSETSPPRQPDSPASPPAGTIADDRHDEEEVPAVVWGPLVFEARRFVELRKKSFWDQFSSAESFGMGVFYTLNVFFIQFYLGTARLQLQYKGDLSHDYTNLINILVVAGVLGFPVVGWLLDKQGYGITLGTINALAILSSAMQAIPNLGLQALTIVVWVYARYFMYTSYYTVFGALFGFANFGKMVAIDNTINGLFGLLQYPLTYLAIHKLDGNFMWINIAQAVILFPLFAFCFFMHKWETEDLVPIRPMEGEELPCDMLGPGLMKRRNVTQRGGAVASPI